MGSSSEPEEELGLQSVHLSFKRPHHKNPLLENPLSEGFFIQNRKLLIKIK